MNVDFFAKTMRAKLHQSDIFCMQLQKLGQGKLLREARLGKTKGPPSLKGGVRREGVGPGKRG